MLEGNSQWILLLDKFLRFPFGIASSLNTTGPIWPLRHWAKKTINKYMVIKYILWSPYSSCIACRMQDAALLTKCAVKTNPLAYKESCAIQIGIDWIEELSWQVESLCNLKTGVSTFHTVHWFTFQGGRWLQNLIYLFQCQQTKNTRCQYKP